MIKISYLEINEEYAIINIDSPIHGHFDILIDLEDVDKCKYITWSIQMVRSGKDKSYIEFYATNNKIGMLHRYLMTNDKNMVVDHINGDTYDNRKYNLRVCTQEDNHKNRRKQRNNTSGHRGVLWYPYNNVNKWMAHIRINCKSITLGYYDKLDDAVEARRKGEIKYFGEYQRAEEFL